MKPLFFTVFFALAHYPQKSRPFYPSVAIGKQIWMAENLNTAQFRNGDWIMQAKTDEEWIKAEKDSIPAWCYYNNDPKNGEIYGKLYNEHAVFDPRGLAPAGWHIPSDNEWEALAIFLGGRDVAGALLKEKGTRHWLYPNEGATDSFGFRALPGGYRIISFWATKFEYLGENCIFWTSTRDRISTEIRKISFMNTRLGGFGWGGGFSVRCMKDE